MAKNWAIWFYNSTRWQKTREAYYASQYGLCEKCSNAGEIVHHIEYITQKNIHDVNITLNWENLMLCCRHCHEEAHRGLLVTADGIKFDEEGNVIYENKDIS